MNAKDRYFNVNPKIVKADKESTLTITPLFDHVKLKSNAKYYMSKSQLEQKETIAPEKIEIFPLDGSIKIDLFFEGEQEHIINIFEIIDQKQTEYYSFNIYSLNEDLFLRNPYKGDLHMHSYYSDGIESPAYVAASCRKVGLDFMAITDHHKYAPSLEAIEAFKTLDINLKIFPGEEVHPPQNKVHMINFGGSFSINKLFKDEKTYMSEVEELIKDLEPDCPLNDEDKYQYASCLWCFNKIRQAGGMGIYCHPFWVTNLKYNVSASLNEYMFKNKPFDAYEILGGYYINQADSNTLQVAFYNEQREKGHKVPIVGVTDAHGCDRGTLFGWYYTIIFSPNLELENIVASIKDFYSVAVEALPGECTRAYGPFRLVKYALFLIKEVFPSHDAICFEEGKRMIEFISNNNNNR